MNIMKKIAIFIQSITIEYSLEILTGVSEFFKDKDAKLIIGQIKAPRSSKGLYEYQNWSAAHYLLSDDVDGILIVAGGFPSDTIHDDLVPLILQNKKRPIVSISTDTKLSNFTYTYTDCQSAYDELISHLKNRHNCKRFAFMTAALRKAVESEDRFNAFKNALKKNNLQFDKKLVLDSDFTPPTSKAEILKRYKHKEDIDFDAILAASDLMATGIMEAFNELGVKVPEDVKLVGFDESIYAANSIPTMTTIDQNMSKQGYTGAKLLWEKMNGEKIPRKFDVSVSPLYRQSCGCIPLTSYGDIYKSSDGRVIHKEDVQKSKLRKTGQFFNFLSEIDNIYALFDMSKSATTLKNLSLTTLDIMEYAKINNLAIFLFDQPKTYKNEDDFELPEQMQMILTASKETKTLEYNQKIYFNPKKELFPNNLFKDEKGFFILQPIFSGETNYGYLICQLESEEIAVYSIFLKIIVNTISQAYEYTTTQEINELLSHENQVLQMDNSSLSIQKNTDELTKILNRRGFLEFGQRQLNIATEMNTPGLVLFFDMDSLKYINDTFGHEQGDIAIETQAKVIAHALRINDIVARIGGDEFAAIAVGMTIDQLPKFRKKLEKYSEEFCKMQNLPFVISCSVGAAVFDKTSSSLQQLLSVADQQLYNEKRIKHAAKGQNHK